MMTSKQQKLYKESELYDSRKSAKRYGYCNESEKHS